MGCEHEDSTYIIQGSNDPLIITFDDDVSELPQIIVSLWVAKPGIKNDPLKIWYSSDLSVDGDTVYCPLSERETARFPDTQVEILAKALDDSGHIRHWKEVTLDIMARKDKNIFLTEAGDPGG